MSKSNNRMKLILSFLLLSLLECKKNVSDTPHPNKNIDTVTLAEIKTKEDSTNHLQEINAPKFSDTLGVFKATQLGLAINDGDTARMQELIVRGDSRKHALSDDEFVYPALFAALYLNKTEVVKYIIKKKLYDSINEIYDDVANSPLTLACQLEKQSEAIEISKFFVELGANVNGPGNLGGDYTLYPIIIAVTNNNLKLVTFLLEQGADANVQNYDGDTPLAVATKKGFSEIQELLIQK